MLESTVPQPTKNRYIFLSSGEELETVEELVRRVLKSEQAIKEITLPGKEEHKGFIFHWDSPTIGNGMPLYLRQEQPCTLRQVTFIRIIGKIRFEVSEFSLLRGVLGNTKVVWGNGQFIGQDAIILATKDELGEGRLSISVKEWNRQKVPDWFNS